MARINAASIAFLSTTAAFVPPKPITPTLHLNSLSDQLSQLNYDSFAGKASLAVKTASAPAVSPSVVDAKVSDGFNVPDVSAMMKDIKLDFLPSLPSDIQLPSIQLPDINIQLPSSASLESIEATLTPLYSNLQQSLPLLSTMNISPTLLLVLSTILTYSLINTLLTWGASPPPSSPYPLSKYDPITARRYFDKRPLEVLSRGVQVTLLSGAFLLALGGDWLGGKLETNAEKRAVELSELLTKLGPSFIKVRLIIVCLSVL
jgi:hypothetical protein